MRPSTRASRGTKPQQAATSVDLPAPDSPTRAVTSPAATAKLMSSHASVVCSPRLRRTLTCSRRSAARWPESRAPDASSEGSSDPACSASTRAGGAEARRVRFAYNDDSANVSTTRKIDGKTSGHHCPVSSPAREVAMSVPRLACSGRRPMPRNDRVDSCQIACGTSIVTASAVCGATAESTWWRTICVDDAPATREHAT